MERILCLLPNIALAKQARDQLLKMGKDSDDVKVITKNHMCMEFFDEQEPSLTTYTDTVPSLVRGAAIGAFLGVVSYLAYTLYFSYYHHISVGTPFWWVIVGTAAGGWLSMMIGISVTHPRFKRYIEFIEKGHALLFLKNLNANQVQTIVRDYPVELMESY